MSTNPPFNHSNEQAAQSAYVETAPRRNNRTLAMVSVAVVALLMLLVGGVLAVRSAKSTSTDAQASTVAVKQSNQSPTPAGLSPTTAADSASAAKVESTPVDSSAKASNAGAPTVQVPAPAPGPAPAPAPVPKPTAPATPPPAPKPTAPAPVITSFTTPENIDCHNGNSQTFTASWTTTNAVKVTISIDGPGVYKTYPANGSDSLPFNCTSAHSFRLTAFGQDGKTVVKTVTLQPRNAQMP